MMDEATSGSRTWEPNPKEMEAYLSREVELARQNLALLRGRGLRPACSDTLHTIRTYLLAQEEA